MPAGYYKEELNRTVWLVPKRYQNLSSIAVGAYGQVCSAKDTRDGNMVAVKKLSRPFQTVVHAKRTYREIKLLKHLKHENVIGLIDTFTTASSLSNFDDVYLVTPLMGADLNSVGKVQRLSDDHVQFLIYQVLRGLKYVHSAGIIHRDLKPSNIAVNEDCELKILDFGLARMTDDSMTGYVATRWYRAPEIMLNWMHYNQTVDIWSVGCIMAELLTSKVLFPGGDHIDQLTKIMQLVGKPSPEFLSKITSANAVSYINSMPEYKKKPFLEIFIGANPLAIDLLEKMLILDPDHRIKSEEAIKHRYLEKYHDPEDEPIGEPFSDEYESAELNVDQWRELTYKAIVNFQSEEMDTA